VTPWYRQKKFWVTAAIVLGYAQTAFSQWIAATPILAATMQFLNPTLAALGGYLVGSADDGPLPGAGLPPQPKP